MLAERSAEVHLHRRQTISGNTADGENDNLSFSYCIVLFLRRQRTSAHKRLKAAWWCSSKHHARLSFWIDYLDLNHGGQTSFRTDSFPKIPMDNLSKIAQQCEMVAENEKFSVAQLCCLGIQWPKPLHFNGRYVATIWWRWRSVIVMDTFDACENKDLKPSTRPSVASHLPSYATTSRLTTMKARCMQIFIGLGQLEVTLYSRTCLIWTQFIWFPDSYDRFVWSQFRHHSNKIFFFNVTHS